MNKVLPAQQPLAGWQVLVTRPHGQGEVLCRLIAGAGGQAVRFPLLAIEPIEDAQRALDVLGRLDQCDWLIFISANAVRFACRLGAWQPSLSAHTRIAAIGRGTAAELQAAGLAVDLQPKAQFNSETLLDAPEFASVTGQRIVIVRGCGGREKLADALRQRGARVDYAEVYRRVPAVGGDAALLRSNWRNGGIQAVTVTSGDALHNLIELLGETDAGLLVTTPFAVIGERVAELARGAGCRRLVVAPEASDEGLYAAVLSIAAARWA